MSMHDGPHGADVPPAAPPPPEGPRETSMTDRIDLGAYLNRAWELFTANAGLLVGGFAIVFIILLLSAITVIGPLILAGPLMAGYYGMGVRGVGGGGGVPEEKGKIPQNNRATSGAQVST